MRKIALFLTIFLAAIVGIGIVITSCDKDDFTEEDAIKMHNEHEILVDSIDRLQDVDDVLADYTVMVVDAAANISLKSGAATEVLA